MFGLAAKSGFLSPDGLTRTTGPEVFADNVDHLVDLVGIDHVIVGTDVGDERKYSREGMARVRRLYPEIPIVDDSLNLDLIHPEGMGTPPTSPSSPTCWPAAATAPRTCARCSAATCCASSARSGANRHDRPPPGGRGRRRGPARHGRTGPAPRPPRSARRRPGRNTARPPGRCRGPRGRAVPAGRRAGLGAGPARGPADEHAGGARDGLPRRHRAADGARRERAVPDGVGPGPRPSLKPYDHPSRALMGRYLAWAYERIVAGAPAGTRVVRHPVRAVGLTARPDGGLRLELDGGEPPLDVDAVVLATGHTGRCRPTRATGSARSPRGTVWSTSRPASRTRRISTGWRQASPSRCGAGDELLRPGHPVDVGARRPVRPVRGRDRRGARPPRGRAGAGRSWPGRLRYLPSGREPLLLVGSGRACRIWRAARRRARCPPGTGRGSSTTRPWRG
ncbi:FAD/NAD(P)-binding protein [Streptomyces sp. M19]